MHTPDKNSIRYPFIAEHRGGPLTKENHRKLIRWARDCSEHVLPFLKGDIDPRLSLALSVAKEWENGRIATGAAMKASLGAHAAARAAKDPVSKAVARSIGQTVATAHMADHSLGGAFYALKAVRLANGDLKMERTWQVQQLSALSPEIREMVQTMWKNKGLDGRT
jgi:hypothetical protein